MKAGKLRHKVELQTGTRVRDSSGQFSYTWATVATFRAYVNPTFGSEDDTSGQQRAIRNYTVTTRAGRTISPTQRLAYDGRTLNIISVSDVKEAGRELVIICREEVTS